MRSYQMEVFTSALRKSGDSRVYKGILTIEFLLNDFGRKQLVSVSNRCKVYSFVMKTSSPEIKIV